MGNGLILTAAGPWSNLNMESKPGTSVRSLQYIRESFPEVIFSLVLRPRALRIHLYPFKYVHLVSFINGSRVPDNLSAPSDSSYH